MSQNKINLLEALKPFLGNKNQELIENVNEFITFISQPDFNDAIKIFKYDSVRDEKVNSNPAQGKTFPPVAVIVIILLVFFLASQE